MRGPRDLIREIHRRSLWQVTGIYTGACWVIFQGVQSLVEGLQLPAWVPGFALVLMLVGLPIVVATAFVQEGVGTGVGARDEKADVAISGAAQRIFTWRNAIGGGVVAAAVWGVVAAVWLLLVGDISSPVAERSTKLPEAPVRSLAVLPLDNLSPDPAHAYFAAGVHEEILNQLVKVGNLSVIARTSVRQYEGTIKTVPEIAAELGVGAVVEGSVRYADDRVRITAQLIDARTGSHLWSETYDRELSDVFGVQSEVAVRVATALHAELTPGERRAIETPPTRDGEAYRHYIHALTLVSGLNSLEPTHAALDRAIELDPEFALALAMKSFLYATQINFPTTGVVVRPENAARFEALAEEYSDRAISLDPSQAAAYMSRSLLANHRGDWERDLEEAARAYELNPNQPFVRLLYAQRLVLRRMPEAKRLLELALETDPNNPAVFWNVSGLYWQMEEYGLSLRAAREAADMAPNAPIFLSRYAQTAAWAGKLELAAELAERSEELYRPPQSPSTQDAVLYLSLIACYARIGLVQKAQHAFDDLIQLEGGVVTVDVLWQANLFLGRFDVAMDLLNEALEERFPGAVNSVAFTSRHPVFDPVREHPGFQRALAKVRRPEST